MNQAVSFLAAASDHHAGHPAGEVPEQRNFPVPSSALHSRQMGQQLSEPRPQALQNLSEQVRQDVTDTDSGGKDMSLEIPGEIWQHIFSYLPPTTLGRLLSVNRKLNQLLTAQKPQNPRADETRPSHGILELLSSSEIWSLSRKLYHNDWPDPIYPLDEYFMCKLIFTKRCACCNSKAREDTASGCVSDNDGVSILWPFGTQMCRSCFATQSRKELDLMFTPSMPSILIPGLAFAYFTADMKYVRSISLPTNEAVSKHFYTPQVKDIQRRFQEVSSFDASIAQDWLKNLEMHCMRVLVRAAEWEQWETNGGLMRLYHDMKQGREKLIDGSTASEQSHQRQQPTLSEPSVTQHGLNSLFLTSAPSSTPVSQAVSGENPIPLAPKSLEDPVALEWNKVQQAIRACLEAYVDDHIRQAWHGGSAITKKTCSKFAATTLVMVAQCFYRNVRAQDDQNQRLGIPIEEDPPEGPWKRKISLDDMKYIFDRKIKPFTEKYTRELFFCSGCENNTKMYGFEGVIQHFAAKHTCNFSLGSVIVHWRAEWPANPPFIVDADQARRKLKSRLQAPPGNSPLPPNGTQLVVQPPRMNGSNYSMRNPKQQLPPSYIDAPLRPAAQQHPAVSYPTPQSAATYSFPPYGTPPDKYNIPSATQNAPEPVLSHITAPPSAPTAPARALAKAAAKESLPTSKKTALQLDEMAKDSRSVWNATSGIRTLPQNVRAHLVLFHAQNRFQSRFGYSLPFKLFTHGINTHAQMKPIKSLSDLVCKGCNPIEDTQESRASGLTKPPRTFTFPGLMAHFKVQHMDRPGPSRRMDWKYDMLLLPDHLTIAQLVDAPGMDEQKMRLIAGAFPQIFPQIPDRPFNSSWSAPSQEGPQNHYLYPAAADQRSRAPTSRNTQERDAYAGNINATFDRGSTGSELPVSPSLKRSFDASQYDRSDNHFPTGLGMVVPAIKMEEPEPHGSQGPAFAPNFNAEQGRNQYVDIGTRPAKKRALANEYEMPREPRASRDGNERSLHSRARPHSRGIATLRDEQDNVSFQTGSEDGEVPDVQSDAPANPPPTSVASLVEADQFLESLAPREPAGFRVPKSNTKDSFAFDGHEQSKPNAWKERQYWARHGLDERQKPINAPDAYSFADQMSRKESRPGMYTAPPDTRTRPPTGYEPYPSLNMYHHDHGPAQSREYVPAAQPPASSDARRPKRPYAWMSPEPYAYERPMGASQQMSYPSAPSHPPAKRQYYVEDRNYQQRPVNCRLEGYNKDFQRTKQSRPQSSFARNAPAGGANHGSPRFSTPISQSQRHQPEQKMQQQPPSAPASALRFPRPYH